jgi:hypothetical protein
MIVNGNSKVGEATSYKTVLEFIQAEKLEKMEYALNKCLVIFSKSRARSNFPTAEWKAMLKDLFDYIKKEQVIL